MTVTQHRGMTKHAFGVSLRSVLICAVTICHPNQAVRWPRAALSIITSGQQMDSGLVLAGWDIWLPAASVPSTDLQGWQIVDGKVLLLEQLRCASLTMSSWGMTPSHRQRPLETCSAILAPAVWHRVG